MNKRKLTKEQIFTFEMRFKGKLKYNQHNFINFNIGKLDKITNELYFYFEDFNIIFEFLNEYKNVIKWDIATEALRGRLTDKQMKKIILNFNEYFNKEAWKIVSGGSVFPKDKDLIRKFKDKEGIDWNWISIYHTFSPSFLLEMKDYVNINKVLNERVIKYNYGSRDSAIVKQVKLYIMDHLEEVLTYKKENKNNETNRL